MFRVKNYDVFQLRQKCLSQLYTHKKKFKIQNQKKCLSRNKTAALSHLNQKKSFIWKSSFLKNLNFALKPLSMRLVVICLANHFLSFSLNFFFVSFSLYLSLQIFLKKKIDQKREEKTFIGNICKSEKNPFIPPSSSKQFSFFSADNTKLKTFTFIKCW